MADPYIMGLKASREGKPLSACPFRKAALKRKWELGWYDGPRAALKEHD